jgi:CheY-like chemotaxis protein
LPGLVLVFEDDLLFASRLELGLQANGYRAQFVTQVPDLREALKGAPVLVLANVGSDRIPWPGLVAMAKARRLPPHPRVLGYGPHVDLQPRQGPGAERSGLRQQALDAGCDAIVARSALAKNLASLLARHAWKPDRLACDRPLPAGLRRGIEQFNRREFYACHDTLEEVWIAEPGDIRLMYQGLIQVSVAFYHLRRGNWRGMLKMMARGKGKLLPFLPICQGIDLEALLVGMERFEAALRDRDPGMMAAFDQFPSICMDR